MARRQPLKSWLLPVIVRQGETDTDSADLLTELGFAFKKSTRTGKFYRVTRRQGWRLIKKDSTLSQLVEGTQVRLNLHYASDTVYLTIPTPTLTTSACQ